MKASHLVPGASEWRRSGIPHTDTSSSRATGVATSARSICCARGNDVLVVAEVKTRVSNRFGAPSEAVGFAKQRKLRRLASVFLSASDRRYEEVRFDVVSIIGNDINVIEAAF